MALKSGPMNKRVTLQRRSDTRDGVGQPLETYTDLGKSWCAIKPISGKEWLAQSGEHSKVTHQLRLRARDDIALQPRDRALYGARVFDIDAVLDEMENGRLWVLMCAERIST